MEGDQGLPGDQRSCTGAGLPQVTAILDCVEAGRVSDVRAELGAAATEVLLAAYRSAASGEVVTLTLPRQAD